MSRPTLNSPIDRGTGSISSVNNNNNNICLNRKSCTLNQRGSDFKHGDWCRY